MSGIQIHTADPISPAKARSTSPTKTFSSQFNNHVDATKTTASPTRYPAARPAQGVPAPTQTYTPPYMTGPPPPQPGQVPSPAPPATTAKATLPPPPKVGEKFVPPQAHEVRPTAPPARSSPPRQMPPQLSHILEEPTAGGVPPSSTTSNNHTPSFRPQADLASARETSPIRANLQNPPGYVQNQHATDMTAEQRLALQQEELAANGSKKTSVDPILGFPDGRSRASSNASMTAAGIWEGAKMIAGQVGQKAGELHGEIWERLNREE